MTYPTAATTFEDLIQLIPPRGTIVKHRFIVAEKPFELRIGRNQSNIVWLEFCVPDGKYQFWPHVRSVESLTRKRDVWAHWQKFLEDPESYLTFKYFAKR